MLRLRPERRASIDAALQQDGWNVIDVSEARSLDRHLVVDADAILLFDGLGKDWLRKVADLSGRFPRLRTLMLVEPRSTDEAVAAIIAGVDGFVAPEASDLAVVRSVRALADVGVSIPRSMVASLVKHVRCRQGRWVESASGQVNLTPREWEIYQLLLQDRSTHEIATSLHVSPGTVRTHAGRITRKLGARNRAELRQMIGAYRAA